MNRRNWYHRPKHNMPVEQKSCLPAHKLGIKTCVCGDHRIQKTSSSRRCTITWTRRACCTASTAPLTSTWSSRLLCQAVCLPSLRETWNTAGDSKLKLFCTRSWQCVQLDFCTPAWARAADHHDRRRARLSFKLPIRGSGLAETADHRRWPSSDGGSSALA